MKAYLDFSSFAKRFINEDGSDQVEQICSEATDIALSVLCVPEIISALNRRQRECAITQYQYDVDDVAKRRIIEDVRDVDIVNLTTSVIGSSIAILESNSVRALDALHVSCALAWNAEIFISSDKRQIDAAKKVGLRTKRV